ncbi:hypothetical protein ADIARSV_2133 [Arcticibacter svalbardensis MN12-7]|uniref:Uncharacterized protein n=1 Tax=Arcticibacter svalbardensis MN12-7 TaxID=1150600 RepID=R9H0L6_9SPHI|nr:hypothetical protein ADIARSV_2133 [Arcticibacter svalbardensis MN12-7]
MRLAELAKTLHLCFVFRIIGGLFISNLTPIIPSFRFDYFT